ncbi:RNA-guided pseudouridylation complex pseudouridine synthase subunit Cbf5 [Candidatus Pacearchaeota archaeon CG10_big_fil_rev_8_21_14_0_10_31_24]|nr:MAG: RNA-guided pseudouridylation complex pseudouridine synthase subunit Cbf5 [Candidatus Pacearchaeota archaeon CG10_big_fil_rev_8_21_14_0_10_31_24]
MINLKKIQSEKPIKDLLSFSIINIDKPSNPTSFTVSQFVRKVLNLSKSSHFGTLDPQVSGVLPVALNRACRLNEYLMHRDKTYVGIMRLHKEISIEELKKIITKFTGKITQLPPIRSNVKRAPRQREVQFFTILEKEDKDILFETKVQAGTYIRTICDNIGKEIGGAHMLELRRTQAGIFSESESYTLYDFEKAVLEYYNGSEKLLRKMLIPGEIVSTLYPVIETESEFIKKAHSGSPIFEKYLKPKSPLKSLNKDDKICLFSDNQFLGIYKYDPRNEIIATPEFVFN